MMFEGEQRVEAERLSQVAQRHVLGQYRSVRAPFLREHVQRDADSHGDLQGISFRIRYGTNYTPSGPLCRARPEKRRGCPRVLLAQLRRLPEGLFQSTPTGADQGTSSLSSSSRFPIVSNSWRLSPVTLPPGRLRLRT